MEKEPPRLAVRRRANRIRSLCERARDRVGLSRTDFAALIGTTTMTISRWERRARPSGIASALLRLVEAFPETARARLGTTKLARVDFRELCDSVLRRGCGASYAASQGMAGASYWLRLAFGDLIGASDMTVQRWEYGRTRPRGFGVALLVLLEALGGKAVAVLERARLAAETRAMKRFRDPGSGET